MQDRKQPETLRLRSIMPALTASDLEKSIAFYRDILGCILVEEMRNEDRLVAAQLRAGNVDLLLSQDDFAKGSDRDKGQGLRLYCTTVQDVDGLAAEITARGGILTQEVADQPWGARDFALEDPDGFKISISTGM